MALLLALASALAVQDGGKLTWWGKNAQSPSAGFAEARRDGKRVLLYFTSHG